MINNEKQVSKRMYLAGCGSCVFGFEPHDGGIQCRRQPPARKGDGHGGWPVMMHTEWCGEFVRREHPYE